MKPAGRRAVHLRRRPGGSGAGPAGAARRSQPVSQPASRSALFGADGGDDGGAAPADRRARGAAARRQGGVRARFRYIYR